MPEILYKQRCPYCDEATTPSNSKGGSMFNRDAHIASCERAPKREQEKAKGRVHWS